VPEPPASLRSRAKLALATRLRRWTAGLGTRLGLEVRERSFYSPIPEIPPAGDPIWTRRSAGLDPLLDLERQLALVRSFRPYLREFAEPGAVPGFTLWNGLYQAGDAETLYALIRSLRPARVIELGSGFSTLVTAAACDRNRREGHPVEAVAFDPQPRTELERVDPAVRLERRDCRTIPSEDFAALEDGDVLFIDTSHAVKLGGEVNWLVLDVLSGLAPGVNVHFHDVFIPYEYPRYLFELGASFNEQYLVQALLTGNQDWEITLALAALFRERRAELVAELPSLAQEVPGMPGLSYVPAAFWIRRRG
jgi:hypothetical protein